MASTRAETAYQRALAPVYALIRGGEYARAIAEMTQAGGQRLAPAFRHNQRRTPTLRPVDVCVPCKYQGVSWGIMSALWY